MNAAEIRAELQKLRGEVWESHCDCCSGSLNWDSDPDGEYVRWFEIEELLKHIEREQQ